MKKTKVKYSAPLIMKWLLYVVTIFLILLTLIVIFALFYNQSHLHDFFPGVKINNQPLNNLSYNQAFALWQDKIDEFNESGLHYVLQNEEIVVQPTLSAATDPDLSYSIISFNLSKTIDNAYFIGRKKGFGKNFWEQFIALFFGYDFSLCAEFNQEELLKILQENLKPYLTAKKEARPQVDEDLYISILAEESGTAVDSQILFEKTKKHITNLSSEPIEVELISDYPTITSKEVSIEVLQQLKDLIVIPALILSYQDEQWSVANEIFKDWFNFKKIDQQIVLGVDASTTAAYLEKEIYPQIYQATVDAKFDVKNGRVVEFQGSQDGQELDLQKSISKIEEELLKNNNFSVDLIVNEVKAKIATASINELGIAEIIGTGQSDFSGSPKNRRHNIAVGAETLNGILIKPDEEFSLNEALGKIDASTGYKPELVIKGNRTIPEYGGGLCQIGTTVFRAALAPGLPITERRNHSYRVVYYEPAGKDATIYNPKPDLKFINDTGKYILIQSRIEGNNLYFDFWGTKDGRIIEQSDSVIYNIKSPGPTQYIETDQLEPDEQQCIESAHNGADAYFDYKVTYSDGEIMQERFTSHYVPWPAKCLVGKVADTATTTEEIIEE
ncbi:VanW family protein [Patescibacteria group bacterium]|nr:VanW family protein [Patescibacteria group bacterium]